MKDLDWRKCVICGDSKDVIKRIPDNSIDFILTDPPYNIGKHSTGNIPLPGRSAINNDLADWDLVEFNPEEWADEFIRILKPKGNLFIFTTYNQLGRWYNCLDNRFDTSNFMIWHKTNPAPKIFKAGFLNSCEMVFTCWNKGHVWNFISQSEMHNFIESPICSRPERLSNPKHPAQKPISILKKMIRIASNPDDIVFDPFMGVGSTGVAAIQEGRKFIGIEINKSYFCAAKDRIEKEMEKTNNMNAVDMVNEPLGSQSLDLFGLEDIFPAQTIASHTISRAKRLFCQSSLKPIIKWPGGKEKELKFILPNAPSHIENYYEPFVGGGSVYAAFQANHYFINDLSSELIALYRFIANKDETFFQYAKEIDNSWNKANRFFYRHIELVDEYVKYRTAIVDANSLDAFIQDFCKQNREEISAIVPSSIKENQNIFTKELVKNLSRKMLRMKVLEDKKHLLPEEDLYSNIETAIKSALYMYYRTLYNGIGDEQPQLRTALFLFIRNYAYSGMFRYNDKGQFNVPYGGIAYNGKSMDSKLSYYKSSQLQRHFGKTTIYNLDFEDFIKKTKPGQDDFVFLDPPYDTEFSTYAKNEFTKESQARLADLMLHHCKAKWMLVIKDTDYIRSLYKNKEGINIRTFEKEYLVNFMNRNDKKAEHLLITNY
jgi:DNA adenine methylase